MYTSDDLIEDARLRGAIPNAQQLFTPARIAALMNGEMKTLIVPQIMSVKESYFQAYNDQLIIQNVLSYDIHERAIGMKVKDLSIVDSLGQKVSDLPQIDLKLANFQNYYVGFYFENNQIVLCPMDNPYAGQYLRHYFFRRPNEIVLSSAAGQISSIDTGLNTVVLDNVPSTFEIGTSVCVIKGKPGFDCKVEATPIVSVSAPTIGLTSVDGLVIGDWIALEGESPIPQIPVEAHPVLTQAAVVKVMEALGDSAGMSAAQNKLNEARDYMFTVINPRADNSPKKITDSSGIFNFTNFRGRRW